MNIHDQYLLFRLKTKGDAQAFARLYDRYVVSIYRFVFFKLPSKELAEDVTSETFLRCWQFLQQNKNIVHFRAFLYRIARNLVIDTYRKQGAEKTLIQERSVTFFQDDSSSYYEQESSDQARG